MRVVALLLAAGSSRRFGGDKLRAPYRGRPLIEHALDALLAAKGVDSVIVVVKPGDAPPARARCVAVENPEHAEGLGASLRAGVQAAPADADAYLVALADMPDVGPATIDALVERFASTRSPIVVPVHGGRRGHPVVLGASLRAELLALAGDTGARGILERHPGWVETLATDDPAVVRDVDVAADLEPDGAGDRVLVKGAGEQASATAHRLFRCGYRVAMTDLERPHAIRRAVSFAAALYEGAVEVEGVRGVALPLAEAASLAARDWSDIPVVADPANTLVALWRPDVIVDGRLLKRNLDNRCSDAPLVIGLGPGLVAGRDVHFVVETARGHHLGRVIASGPAQRNTGEPGEIGGYTRERLLLAPADGVFATSRRIGETVAAGESVGRVGAHEVRTAIAGVLRGLAWPGLEVRTGQKIGDVDPRGEAAFCWTLSDKARAISGSVLEIVVAHAGPPSRRAR